MKAVQVALMMYLIYLYSTELTPGQPIMHIMIFSWLVSWAVCWLLTHLGNVLRWAYHRLTSRRTLTS
jgi:hypothetical protein